MKAVRGTTWPHSLGAQTAERPPCLLHHSTKGGPTRHDLRTNARRLRRPVRDPAALDQLPDDERTAWRRLWEDVAALRQKVEEKK
jgi:hypothetical protein